MFPNFFHFIQHFAAAALAAIAASSVFLGRSSKIQPGWMSLICPQLFLWVRDRASAGPSKEIQRPEAPRAFF